MGFERRWDAFPGVGTPGYSWITPYGVEGWELQGVAGPVKASYARNCPVEGWGLLGVAGPVKASYACNFRVEGWGLQSVAGPVKASYVRNFRVEDWELQGVGGIDRTPGCKRARGAEICCAGGLRRGLQFLQDGDSDGATV